MKGFGVVAAGLCLTLVSSALHAESAVELFQRAKSQVKAGAYADCLKTLDALDAATSAGGQDGERRQIEPILAFYRGVCFAGVDRPRDAQDQFLVYLGLNPNAAIDEAVYPKKVVSAFKHASAELNGGRADGALGSLSAEYSVFPGPVAKESVLVDGEWANGPVRLLLTEGETREFRKLTDVQTREDFVVRFWASRNSKSGLPGNGFQKEFERRVAFADQHFSQGEAHGSLTDRGMVFILLGPPTYAGRRPIGAGEDKTDSAGMSTSGRHDGAVAASGRSVSGLNPAALDSGQNWQEVWHYRHEVLPRGVPYQQVDFPFLTRKGYGENVLQRTSSVLSTLEASKGAP